MTIDAGYLNHSDFAELMPPLYPREKKRALALLPPVFFRCCHTKGSKLLEYMMSSRVTRSGSNVNKASRVPRRLSLATVKLLNASVVSLSCWRYHPPDAIGIFSPK